MTVNLTELLSIAPDRAETLITPLFAVALINATQLP